MMHRESLDYQVIMRTALDVAQESATHYHSEYMNSHLFVIHFFPIHLDLNLALAHMLYCH